MIKLINRLICNLFGHKLTIYTYYNNPCNNSYDIEMAGHCERCGWDSHEN